MDWAELVEERIQDKDLEVKDISKWGIVVGSQDVTPILDGLEEKEQKM